MTAVTDFSDLFRYVRYFNEALLGWDTSGVTDMSAMFMQAFDFNQPLLFDTSSVGDMSLTFAYAYAFNQPLVFDVSSVSDMTDSTLRESNSHSSNPHRRAPPTRGSED